MTFAECISCGSEIKFSHQPKMGSMVTCSECDAELEVVWLDPIELDWPFDDEEYDDEDDDDYYYEEDENDDYQDVESTISFATPFRKSVVPGRIET